MASTLPVVLVVDDDAGARELVAEDLADHAAAVLQAGDLAAGVELARTGEPDVVLLDIRLPPRAGAPAADCGLDGIAAVRAAGGAPVIILSTHDRAATGMQALRQGAADFVAKPYAPEQLVAAIARALDASRAGHELAYLRRENEALGGGAFLVGDTAAMREVAATIRAAAPTDATVLITGETGTGKELVARAIHAASHRGERPFIAVNAGAIPRELVESALFGHERGAFTGADRTQAGRFEIAERGTLFFDEIGEVDVDVQVKLLRVLQEGTYERVGGHKTHRADVRIVAATHRDLAAEVRAGRFRRDLFYRLNVVPIVVPPLRERPADLRALMELFLGRYARRYGRTAPSVDEGTLAALARHDWPGNIRELEHLAQRLVVLRPAGEPLRADDLPLEYRYGALLAEPLAPSATAPEPGTVLRHAMEAFERDFILKTLARCGGNRTHAARLLGIHPATMFRKINRHDLDEGEGG